MDTPKNFQLKLGDCEYLPLMLGGMGVDISTSEMVLEAVSSGCVAHLSDAMIPAVCDKNFGTRFIAKKVRNYYESRERFGDSEGFAKHDLHEYRLAQLEYLSHTVQRKTGSGGIFVNCMEKIQAGSPVEILQTRLIAALDAGVDGLSLSAGLHGHSLRLMSEHPRFREVKIGIVVSSWRALKIFLRSARKVNRLPDYVVVEGPLAGGHLGFPLEGWAQYDLHEIFADVQLHLREEGLDIPVIPAGGIFDASDALSFLKNGAAAVQVGTRFTVAKESGLPDHAKQAYFEAEEEDVLVSNVSPTGYPIRLLRNSPCLHSNVNPMCIPLGYALDPRGKCQYIDAYNATECSEEGVKRPVESKVCLCFHIGRYDTWTCGSNVTRLKHTAKKDENGIYIQPSTRQLIGEYLGD